MLYNVQSMSKKHFVTCRELAGEHQVSVWTVYRAIARLTPRQQSQIQRMGRTQMIPERLAPVVSALLEEQDQGHAEWVHKCHCGREITGNAYYWHARHCAAALAQQET